ASLEAAAAQAAHDTLTALFPSQAGTFDSALAADLAGIPPAGPARASRGEARSPGRSSTGGGPTAPAPRGLTRRGPTRGTGGRPRPPSCRPWPRSGGT